MKKVLVLISVAAVLFSSGCLEGIFGSGDTITTSYGLTVNSFEPDFTDIEGGDDFEIYLEIQNNGGSVAEEVYAHLYDVDLTDWQVQPADGKLSLGDLDPPDDLSGIPGDIADDSWDLVAPTNPEGVVYKYTPRMRLMYKYNTAANAQITVLKKEEYKRLQERGQLSIPSIITEVSKGPLAVDVSARTPVIIEDLDEDTLEFRVNIDLVGKGSVFNTTHSTDNPTVSMDELDKIYIKITAPGINSAVDCDAYDDTDGIDMRRGKSVIYTCEFKLDDFTAMKNIPITVELDYGYFEDYSTTVNVMGEK